MVMKPEDLQKAPKLLAENIRIGHSPEYFVIGISSGARSEAYSLTPQHTKRLLQYLEHEIKNFEEEYGEITAKWNPNVVSPLQRGHPPTTGS